MTQTQRPGAPASVCLLVDNPLRDLDGLVLLAWQLAQRGLHAWLVPMYDQALDIQAINPDVVLLNYVRRNNAGHVLAYLRQGRVVGVLDTEGVGHKSSEDFAERVASTGLARSLDFYCTWGESQASALRRRGVVDASRLTATGCPRYDYCAEPWREVITAPAEPGFVLVNTNFPTVNPRFSSGPEAEVQAAIDAGASEAFARRYVADARLALNGMLAMLNALLPLFPDQRFVLRPHPFESRDAYLPLARHPNFEMRQEATSVEWLSHAAALIHLNCSTAVEARMLGVPAISPVWLDTETLRVALPSQLSWHAPDVEGLCRHLAQVLEGKQRSDGALAPLKDTYHLLDGLSAGRTADAIVDAIDRGARSRAALPAASLRLRLRQAMQRLLAPLARRHAGGRQAATAKAFTAAQVESLLERLARCVPSALPCTVERMNSAPLQHARLASGRSLLVQSHDSPAP